MSQGQFIMLWVGLVIMFALNALILGNRFDSVDKQLKQIKQSQEARDGR